MRVWIRVSLILFALTAHGCTQPSQASGFSPGVEPRRSSPRTASPEQPSDVQLKARLAQLLRQLSSEKYKERGEAYSQLSELLRSNQSGLVLAYLERAYGTTKDPEVKERLDRLLEPYSLWLLTPTLLSELPNLLEKLESEDDSVREQVATELGHKKPRGAAGLLARLLKDKHSNVCVAAMQALGTIGDKQAVEALIGAWRNNTGHARLSAAESLMQADSEKAVELLIKTLKYHSESVCQRAAELLGEIGDRRALEPLMELLQDESMVVRHSAAMALGDIGDKKAIEPLVEALTDEEWCVRASAARALGKIGDKKVTEPLLETLKDEQGAVRRRGAEALKNITKQDFGRDYEKWKKWYEKTMKNEE